MKWIVRIDVVVEVKDELDEVSQVRKMIEKIKEEVDKFSIVKDVGFEFVDYFEVEEE